MKYWLSIWNQRWQYLLIFLVSTVVAGITALSSQSQSLSETAHSASSFVDSIGVVVHLNRTNSAYGEYDSIIKPKLQELGIHHIRDGVALNDTVTQAKLSELATLGIKSTLVMDPRDQATASVAVDIVKAMPTSVEAVEGPNEWDVWENLTYKDQPFPAGVKIFQSELYGAIKGDPATAQIDVLSPTVALWANASQLGAVDCDYGAMHSYPGGEPPTAGLDWHWIPATQQICPGKSLIATESGWHNAVSNNSGQPGVSEAAAGKYFPRLWLEYFNRDIRRVYLNELIDKWKSSDKEGNFGLLRQDGSPKPAFEAIKNLVTLLQDPASAFSPGTLSYTMTGETTNVHHTLLQKQNGHFYLILWQEVPSFDLSTQQDISVPNQIVTIQLETAITAAKLYQPLQSVESTAQYTSPRSLVLNVNDAPAVLELVPA
ncbi:hypothetical protein [Leptothoe sp. PORK10 BA2]|uniref:hypothetical protein n=1 Tax=Leptothoe sp. PORK10 BA2 TaxID=3110254 RepID=UPI002B21476C|nr:hypothetical protein [Leptothoe sp. PORK10 BA2]MEA5465660.1 hypothetical protein [Leptothoe sp. PORK10 BA2]